MKSKLLAVLFCLCAVNLAAKDAMGELPPPALAAIAVLDVPRYMGTWYEIAKFPNSFQKKCIGYTKAQYSLTAEGGLKVINSCKLANGEMNEAIGAAKQVGLPTSATLKVRFAPAWLSFIPAVWGDYWVIDLDDNYQLVAVSEPTREFLWILSRAPMPDKSSYESLLGRLTRMGFNVQKLELTRQGN